MLLLTAVSGPATAARPYEGRRVVDVLRELEAQGLRLIYNDELVPRSLEVMTEPTAAGGIRLAEQLLVPHGLTVREIGKGTWAIVHADPPASADPGPVLDEIVVSTSRYSLGQDSLAAPNVLTRDALRVLPKMADEPLRAVHRLPGAASNGFSGLARIRGGEEDEAVVLLDGMPLRSPFHLQSIFGPVSVLDAAIVDSLEVHTGGFPVRFGNQMSAVIDIRSASPDPDLRNELGLSLFHSNGSTGGTFADGRGDWILSGRRSNLDEFNDLIESDLGDPHYLDSFAKVGIQLGENTRVSGHVLVSRDQIRVEDDDIEFADVDTRNAHVWGTLEHRLDSGREARLLLGFTRLDTDRDGRVDDPGRRTGAVADRRELSAANLKLELAQRGGRLMLSGGVEGAVLDAAYDYTSMLEVAAGVPFPQSPAIVVERHLTPDPSGGEAGVFASARWNATARLTAEAGLRWDTQSYDQVGGGTQLSPRANFRYDIDADSRVRLSWGRFHQAQDIMGLKVEDGIDRFFPAQRADHAILSYERTLPVGVDLRVEGYLKDYETLKPRFENLFDPFVLIPELQTDRVAVVPTEGSARGLELLVTSAEGDPWGWWFSYAWARVEETVDGRDALRSWDQRHTVNTGVSWRQGPWEWSLAGTYHTGWPVTPVSLVAGMPDDEPEVEIGVRNASRFSDFRSVDTRLAYSRAFGSSEATVFVEITNLIGQKNPCCVDYTVRDGTDGQPELIADFDHWPRFVPNLGVAWRF